MKKLLLPFLIGLLSATPVSAHSSDAETTVDVIAKTTKSWNGKQLPSYLSGTPEITILRITIPPGISLPLHIHPVINAGVMMQGALTVFTEDEQILHLKAGDPIVEVVDTWHYGKNEGSEPVVLIMFYAGREGTPITVVDTVSADASAKYQEE